MPYINPGQFIAPYLEPANNNYMRLLPTILQRMGQQESLQQSERHFQAEQPYRQALAAKTEEEARRAKEANRLYSQLFGGTGNVDMQGASLGDAIKTPLGRAVVKSATGVDFPEPTYDVFNIYGPQGQEKRVERQKGTGEYAPPEGWSTQAPQKPSVHFSGNQVITAVPGQAPTVQNVPGMIPSKPPQVEREQQIGGIWHKITYEPVQNTQGGWEWKPVSTVPIPGLLPSTTVNDQGQPVTVPKTGGPPTIGIPIPGFKPSPNQQIAQQKMDIIQDVISGRDLSPQAQQVATMLGMNIMDPYVKEAVRSISSDLRMQSAYSRLQTAEEKVKFINTQADMLRQAMGGQGQAQGQTSQPMAQKPQGQVALPPTVRTTSEAVQFLMQNHKMSKDQAIQWIRENAS